MRPSVLFDQNRDAIRAVVAADQGRKPRVFGSVLVGADTDSSDLGLLVEPAEGMSSLFDIGGIRWKLHDLVGIRVDVVSPRSLPDSFRDDVLATAEPV